MHTPYLEITVIFLAVLRVAVPILALLGLGWIMDRLERRPKGAAR